MCVWEVQHVGASTAGLQDEDDIVLVAQRRNLSALLPSTSGVGVKAAEERGRIPANNTEGEKGIEDMRRGEFRRMQGRRRTSDDRRISRRASVPRKTASKIETKVTGDDLRGKAGLHMRAAGLTK